MSRQHVADAGDAAVWAADYGQSLQCTWRPGAVPQQILQRLKVARPVTVDERHPELVIRHGQDITKAMPKRRKLTAFLSTDEGKTWSGTLLLDECANVSYPDIAETPDGDIYVLSDRDRTGAAEILFARFREEDLQAGKRISTDAALKNLVTSKLGMNHGSSGKELSRLSSMMKPVLHLITALLVAPLAGSHAADVPVPRKHNVLFIAIDDLKPLLGCYGASWIRSPNIDRLASRGTRFTANHCQVSFCAPSRFSLLTGLRPDTTHIVVNPAKPDDLLRKRFPDIVTLPQHFKNNGFLTCAMGKVFDGRTVDDGHDAASWSVPYVRRFNEAPGGLGKPPGYQNRSTRQQLAAAAPGTQGPPVESEDVPDNAYYDGAMARTGAAKIRDCAKAKQPFFLAVGFLRPHLPFIAPKKYWDLYDRANLPLAPFQTMPTGSPHDLAFYSNSGELRAWSDVPKTGAIPEALQRELIHGYAASVSYADANVGLLMAALEESGELENTIVCVWGDHGWHLGEHGHWGKVTNYEDATRAPLIISAPGHRQGAEVKALTEFLDVYPTLCDLAGLPRPAHLQGTSLTPLLGGSRATLHEAAISQMTPNASKDGVMGWTLRTPRYRYIEWRRADLSTDTPRITDQIESVELYDYQTDPLECENLAGKTEHAAVLKEHQALFDKLLLHLPKRRIARPMTLPQASPD